MKHPDPIGRPNQRRRTRKDLLQAASRLMKLGRKPSLEEIAAEAMVSRATAYRYFPSVEALHNEALLDLAIPGPDDLFAGSDSLDPVARVQEVDTALHEMILANEAPLRMMLVHTLERSVRGDAGVKGAKGAKGAEGEEDGIPPRQNRRSPLIAAALAPARRQFKPADLDRLTKALALIIGTEAMVVTKDVLQLKDADAREVKQWAIGALINAAKKTSAGG